MHNEHPRPRRKAGPVALRIAKRGWDPVGVRREVRGGDMLWAQDFGAYRFVGPVDVGLRIIFLGDESIHCPRAFRFLRIVNGSYSYPCLLLEVSEDGFRKDFVMADVDDDALCLVRGMEPPPGGRDASEHKKNYPQSLFHAQAPWVDVREENLLISR